MVNNDIDSNSSLRPFSLRFQSRLLEREFISYYDFDVRIFNRIGIVLSYLSWLALGIFSYISFPDDHFQINKIIAIFLYPVFTLNLLILISCRLVRYYQPLTAISNGLAGLSIIYIGQYVIGNNLLEICGIIIVVLFAFFILRLRFTIALATTLVYVIIYQITMFGKSESGVLSMTLWIVEITCIVGGNLLERANRKTFYQNKRRQVAEEKNTYLAYHDMLTGLPNRFLFTEKLEELVNSKRELAVLFIDMDQFKKINDTRGHIIGDQILKMVAQRLIDCVSEEDIVARLGGDEFTILLQSRTKSEVAQIADKVLREIQIPFFVGDSKFYLRTSIGISLFPTDGGSIETLIKNSDIAMYSSKESGGNSYKFYHSSMNRALEEKVNLERLLHTALVKNEFVIHYQPQIDLRTGHIYGVEALIRWVHPQQGIISPNQFIPIAEETGLIVPIGEWILRTAFRQAKKWNSLNIHPIHMSVNLSVKQLIAGDIVATVNGILRETGLDPNLIELEVTESVFMQDTESMVSILSELKKLGVRISIDDFGTGYSSLAYLKDYPIDSLKVDRSFIPNLPLNEKNTAISSAVITLARNLGMKSVAEGIENLEQLNFFEMEGCDLAQGYYFSRPLPEDKMNELLDCSLVSPLSLLMVSN